MHSLSDKTFYQKSMNFPSAKLYAIWEPQLSAAIDWDTLNMNILVFTKIALDHVREAKENPARLTSLKTALEEEAAWFSGRLENYGSTNEWTGHSTYQTQRRQSFTLLNEWFYGFVAWRISTLFSVKKIGGMNHGFYYFLSQKVGATCYKERVNILDRFIRSRGKDFQRGFLIELLKKADSELVGYHQFATKLYPNRFVITE